MTLSPIRIVRVALVLLFVVLTLAVASARPVHAGPKGSKWTPMGPAPDWQFFPGGETGRATTVAINPFNAQHVWIGTAGGGVWRSLDGGNSWSPMMDDQPSLAIGSIALAGCSATGCTSVYVGTGENAIRRDTYYGAGLLVFSDFNPWTLRDGRPKYDFKYGTIYNVVLDQNTSGSNQTIYITLSSGVTASPSETTVTAPQPKGGYGIYKSVDNGMNWDLEFSGRPTDLEMDPVDPHTLYAGILGRGIFKSTDAGATWCPLNPGVPLPAGCTNSTFNSQLPNQQQISFDHVEIAVDPESSASGGTHLYASFGMCPDRLLADCKPSIYESKDGGGTWTPQFQGTTASWPFDFAYPQCPGGYTRYTHALTVDPLDPGTLWLGGILLCKSINHGATWNEADTSDYARLNKCSGVFEHRCLSHPDHHAVVFAPGGNQVIFDANDGGIAISRDGGSSWGASTKGLSAFEFQAIATNTSYPLGSHNSPYILGGTQDNGGVLWQGSMQWTNTQCCGDGGFGVIDAAPPGNMYMTSNLGTASSTQVLPIRSLDGGITWQNPPSFFGYDFSINSSQPRALYPPFCEDQNPISPQFGDLFFGTTQLWVSDSFQAGVTWDIETPEPPNLDAEPEIIFGSDVITAVEISPNQSSHKYVGYYSGRIFTALSPHCSDAGCFPCGKLVKDGVTLPGCTPLPGPVTWIAVDPDNVLIAYATVSGFSPGVHVYKTTDGGSTWEQVPGSLAELNGVPANTIAIESDNTDFLWLGTDNGIYKSTDGGKAWARFSDGMPRVPVYAITLNAPGNAIVAATHGRGAYYLTTAYVNQKVAGPVIKRVLDQPVLGGGFGPNQACSMRLIRQDGTVCASGSTDALGGVMSTDAQGFLVSNKTGVFANMQYVWACGQGNCLGSDVKNCNVTGNPMQTLEVTCGSQVVTEAVLDPGQTTIGPASSTFTVRRPAPAAGGVFHLLPSLQSGDGTSRILCSVPVSFGAADSTSTIVRSAVAAVSGDPACAMAGVSAEFLPGSSGRVVEDSFPLGDSMHLLAPSLSGSELIAAVRSDPGAGTGMCFDAAHLETPSLGHLHAMKVHFTAPPGGASGGTFTITERSSMGDCSITLPTSAGETPAALAAAVAAAFQAGGMPGPNPGCPADVNPRDVTASGGAIATALASEIEVCSGDPAVGVQVAPREICFSNADCDDGNPCTQDVCLPATGQCQSTPVPNGQTCDDANPCTVGNTCQDGACGAPVVCGGGSLCAPNVCDPATGACVSRPKVCDDGNPCTSDSCDAATGSCSFNPLAGSACDDGDPCTIGDTCTVLPGDAVPVCQGNPKCEDGDACTGDHCDPATGACSNLPIQCDDGNPCTFDSCQAGGGCVATPIPAGSVCDDGNLCTTGGTCQPDPFTGAPTCTSQPVNCDDGDACTMDTCDQTTGGCHHTPISFAEVPTGLNFTSASSFTWPGVGGASFYNTYRGTIPMHMLASRPPAGPLYDQTCFEYGDAHGDGAMITTDTSVPAVGTAFYYLVSEETSCGESSIGSDWNGTPIPNASPCSNPAPPTLVIVKSHVGDFTQGQLGATYFLIVSNSGPGPTFGTVTVTEVAPSGLTLVSMAGPGWSCASNTCTRGDSLGAGLAYPPITVTVNVAATATSPLVNQAGVSGGGSTSAFSSDSTTIIPFAPVLSITKTHSGNFRLQQPDASYTVTVSNTGNAPTSGTVTVTDAPPAGMSVTSMSGTGWTCNAAGCSRSDALAAGASYPDITIAVSVTYPISSSVVNQATVSGGGSPSATASDTTTIDIFFLDVLKQHVGHFYQGQSNATYTLRVRNVAPSTPTYGTVTVTDVVPTGLTLVSMAGTGWTCPASPGNTCSRSDALAGMAYYPDITVTVNVASNAPSSVTNEAGVSASVFGITLALYNDITLIDPAAPALSITKTHTGHFYLGQPDAAYTLTVSNTGNGPTSGTVNVTDAPPAGMSVTSMSGTGWTCSAAGCSRSDALAAGASYPDITVAVSLTSFTSASEVNQATVSGGGSPSATANDTTLIDYPLLAMLKSHTGNFYQGQTNATYTLKVQNQGFGPTLGTVTVKELTPAGLTLVSMAGTGWNCPSPGNTCTRSDVLASTAFYPDLTVTVNVASNAPSSIMNHATDEGGGSIGIGGAFDPTTIDPAAPVLAITKTHTGNFTQGQQGANYTVTVSNTGNAPTSGTITVTETVPSGLVLVSMAGTGWTCPASPGNTCSRSDALAAGASYPVITVTVNVLATATSPQVNQVSASQPGVPPATASDPTVINPGVPLLTVTKTHNANFSQGQTNATYKVTVTNTGPVPTFGPVDVNEMPPPGLTVVSLAGTGWTCDPVHCTRTDPLALGASYPDITITVNVLATATSPQVNRVNVGGGGAPPTMATDSTTIIPAGVPSLSITKTHVGNFTQGQVNATYTLTVANNSGAGSTVGTINVVETPPPGLVLVSMAGSGWSCVAPNCTRIFSIPPGVGTNITVTVNVLPTASSPQINQASVSGGGSAPASTTDPTVILAP